MFDTVEQLDLFIEKYLTELNFMTKMIEQGKDAYQYLLSVIDTEDMEKIGWLIVSKYAGTTMQELAEVTLANRFTTTMEDFKDMDN